MLLLTLLTFKYFASFSLNCLLGNNFYKTSQIFRLVSRLLQYMINILCENYYDLYLYRLHWTLHWQPQYVICQCGQEQTKCGNTARAPVQEAIFSEANEEEGAMEEDNKNSASENENVTFLKYSSLALNNAQSQLSSFWPVQTLLFPVR